tara:strand:+ start:136 stop:498 length:363 start_codon:yes stop_codon:yes gene_type:complete
MRELGMYGAVKFSASEKHPPRRLPIHRKRDMFFIARYSMLLKLTSVWAAFTCGAGNINVPTVTEKIAKPSEFKRNNFRILGIMAGPSLYAGIVNCAFNHTLLIDACERKIEIFRLLFLIA